MNIEKIEAAATALENATNVLGFPRMTEIAEQLRAAIDAPPLPLQEGQTETNQAEQDREVGKKWREDSSLETWFPFSAEELASTKRMLQAACAGLGLINQSLGLDPNDGGAEPILEALSARKDNLLKAFERAASAETALRRLVDECGNDAVPGWEDRMRCCIDNANRLLSGHAQKEKIAGWHYVFGDTGEAGPVMRGAPSEYEINWALEHGHELCTLVYSTNAIASQGEQAVDRAWNKFNEVISDGPDSPFPGMATAFENYYSQKWADPDWRKETSVWAAAWKQAIAAVSPQGGEAIVTEQQIIDWLSSPEGKQRIAESSARSAESIAMLNAARKISPELLIAPMSAIAAMDDEMLSVVVGFDAFRIARGVEPKYFTAAGVIKALQSFDLAAPASLGEEKAVARIIVYPNGSREIAYGVRALEDLPDGTYIAAANPSTVSDIITRLQKALVDAELGKVAMRFVDRAGDVHPGIDDAETICNEFHAAMSAAIDAARVHGEKG